MYIDRFEMNFYMTFQFIFKQYLYYVQCRKLEEAEIFYCMQKDTIHKHKNRKREIN